MPALRCLVPMWIKGANGGLRKSLLDLPKRTLFAHLRKAQDSILDRHVPFGYEDETGFHYGKPDDPVANAARRRED